MKNNNNYQYPVSKETLHKYAESIFKPIRRGECVTTVWVPMAGRRKHNKFIIENINLFEKELPNFEKYLLVYVEPLDLVEESLSGYINLMAKSFVETCSHSKSVDKKTYLENLEIFDNSSSSYTKVLDGFRDLLRKVTNNGLDVVFFVGEFDELTFANKIFYNNLKSLWSGLYPRLHYVFLMRERVARRENISMWGELSEAILQNVIYEPILEDADIKYVIDRISHEFSLEPEEGQKKIITKMCGGHPYLIKVALRILDKLGSKTIDDKRFEEALVGHYELKSVAHGILAIRTDAEKEVLYEVITLDKPETGEKTSIFKFLEDMGFIKNVDGKYCGFSKIFETAVRDLDSKPPKIAEIIGNGGLKLDENTGAVLYKSKTIEEEFSRQEYSVLTLFLKESQKVVSRDSIGGVLWGKQSYEKFSDWAIDQLISKLRKKLSKLGVAGKIATIRGSGYKFVQ